jgi:hypothetical protein
VNESVVFVDRHIKLSISLHTSADATYVMKCTIFCGGQRKQQIHSPLDRNGHYRYGHKNFFDWRVYKGKAIYTG